MHPSTCQNQLCDLAISTRTMETLLLVITTKGELHNESFMQATFVLPIRTNLSTTSSTDSTMTKVVSIIATNKQNDSWWIVGKCSTSSSVVPYVVVVVRETATYIDLLGLAEGMMKETFKTTNQTTYIQSSY